MNRGKQFNNCPFQIIIWKLPVRRGKRKKNQKKWKSIWDLWNTIKRNNPCITGKSVEKEKGQKISCQHVSRLESRRMYDAMYNYISKINTSQKKTQMNFQQFLTVYFWSPVFKWRLCSFVNWPWRKGHKRSKEIISCHPGYFFLSNITVRGPDDI